MSEILFHVTKKSKVKKILKKGLRGRLDPDKDYHVGPMIWLQRYRTLAEIQVQLGEPVSASLVGEKDLALLEVDVEGYELHPDPDILPPHLLPEWKSGLRTSR